MDLMTSARSEPKRNRTRRQTAESSGCLSGFLLPPLAALCVSALLVTFVAGFANPLAGPVSAQAVPQAAPIPAANSGGLLGPFTPGIQFLEASLRHWAPDNNVVVNLAAPGMRI